MRILVTGSRDWGDEAVVVNAINEVYWAFRPSQVVVVHGGNKNPDCPDTIADDYARHLGWDVDEHTALWNLHGKAAGMIRNQEMVDAGADVCLAFIRPCRKSGCRKPQPHDSHGTADCMEKARAAGITVREYR